MVKNAQNTSTQHQLVQAPSGLWLPKKHLSQKQTPSSTQQRPWPEKTLAGKTLWEWMSLLLIPLLVGIGTIAVTWQQTYAQDALSQQIHDSDKRQHESDASLAQQARYDDLLKTYRDGIDTLILDKNLKTSQPGSDVRSIAHSRTLDILRQVDASRKGAVIAYLADLELVQIKHISFFAPLVDDSGLAWREFVKYVDEKYKIGRAISLSQANLSGVTLEEVDLSHADFSQANLMNAKFRSAILEGTDLSFANLNKANFTNVYLDGANLMNANLQEANFSGVTFENANLQKADLRRATLENLDLSEADLSGAKLNGVRLTGVRLTGVRLEVADLIRTNLSGVDLSGAKLMGAKLSFANLNRANFTDADLDQASLKRANLSQADLTGANLWAADLKGANLGRADLTGADLSQADLTGVKNITQSQLSQAKSLSGTTMPDGTKHPCKPEEQRYCQ